MYSYHIFLFPFRWNYSPEGNNLKELSFSKRTEIEKFKSFLKGPKWRPFSDHEDSPIDFYNDATFFYDSIRPSVFNVKTEEDDQIETFGIVQNYIYDFGESPVQYVISTKKFGEFNLSLKKARLNVYQIGVGVLSFHLANESYENPEDILKINDFGRRFFPQFLDPKEDDLLHAPQESALPKKIEIISKSKKEFLVEDFSSFQKIDDKSNIQDLIEKRPNNLPNASEKLIQKFLGERFHIEAKEIKEIEGIVIKPTLDDRLFGICWFGDDDSSNLLKYDSKKKRYGFEGYKSSEYWMRFLFMENGESSCRSRLMRHQLLLNHTYHRWADYGTLYGSTRSTFVSLSDTSDTSIKRVLGSMQRSYFEMVQLVLIQHASIQRFSDEVTILRAKEEHELSKHFFKEARDFYRKYLEFVDRLYFQDVSPLEQANELYHLQQLHLGIVPNLRKLEMEMSEFSNLINRLENERRDKLNTDFGYLAFLLLPATLVVGIFGMETIDDDFDFTFASWHSRFWYSMSLVLLSMLACFVIFQYRITRKNKFLLK